MHQSCQVTIIAFILYDFSQLSNDTSSTSRSLVI